MDEDIQYLQEDSIPSELLCCVCICPFMEPMVHTNCGNTFCKRCIDRLHCCPLCRNSIQGHLIEAPKIILSLLHKLKVVCPTCKNEIERGLLYDHLKKCAILCPNGCGLKIIPRNFEAHELECGEKPIPCCAQDIGCSVKTKRNMMQFHESMCKLAIVKPYLEENQQLDIERRILKEENQRLMQQNQQLKAENKNLADEKGNLLLKLKGQQSTVYGGTISTVGVNYGATYHPPYTSYVGVSLNPVATYYPPYR